MKKINLSYSPSTGKVIDFILLLLGLFSFAGLLLSLFYSDWTLSIGFFIILVALCVFSWKRLVSQLLIWLADYFLATMEMISEIDLNGFSIWNKESKERLLWDDVVNMWLDRHQNLLIQLNDKRTLFLNQNYEGWYALLKNTPVSKMRDASITEYLDELYSGMSACKICGYISVKDGECLCCCEVLSDEENYESENAYIRNRQLLLFSPSGNNEVSFILDDEDNGFVFDDEWKPLVSKDEVRAFSRDQDD